MAISRTQNVSNNASSVGLATPTLNDLIIVWAYNSASTTIPTLPAGGGWTSLASLSGTQQAVVLAYKLSNGGEASTGAWLNANSVVCHVYRGATNGIGAVSAVNSGNGTALSYPALTLQAANNSSWVAAFGGARSATAGMNGTPTGTAPNLGNRTSQTTVNGLDTGATVTGFTAQTLNVTTTGRWATVTVELKAPGAATQTATDSLTTSMTVARSVPRTRTTTDAPTTAEAITDILNLPRIAADTSSTAEAVTAVVTPGAQSLTRTASDAVTTAEAITDILSLIRIATDTLTTAESATATRTLLTPTRTATDAVTTAETVTASKVGGGVFTRTTTEALSTAESAGRSAMSFARSASESVSTAEAIIRGKATARTATDAPTVAMTVARIGLFNPKVAEFPATAEVVFGTKFAVVVRTATDALTASCERVPGLNDGDPVASWPDTSGHSNHAVQASSGLRPLYRVGVINSHSVIRFDGTDDVLDAPTSAFGAMSASATVFVVFKSNTVQTANLIMGWPDTDYPTNRFNLHLPWTDGYAYWDFGGIAIDGTGPGRVRAYWGLGTTSFDIGSFVASPSGKWIYKNGTLLDSTTNAATYTPGSDTLRIGNTSAVDVADVIIFDVALSGTDRANIEKGLANYYGLSVPGGTPVDPSSVAGLQTWLRAETLADQSGAVAEVKPSVRRTATEFLFADVVTPGLMDGDLVASWPISAGAATGALLEGPKGSSTTAPKMKFGALNGRAVVRLAQSTDGMGSNVNNFVSSAPNTVFVVFKQTTGYPGGYNPVGPVYAHGFSSSQSYELGCENTAGYPALTNTLDPALVGSTVIQGSYHIVTGIVNMPAGFLFLDGTQVATNNTFTIQGVGNIYLGCQVAYGVPWLGDVADMVVYAGALSSTDRANVEKGLADYYGLTVAGGTAVDPTTVSGLQAWWRADALRPQPSAVAVVTAGAKVRTATDALTTSEAVSSTKIGAVIRTATDALVTSEVTSKAATHPRTASDNPTTAEAATKAATHPRTATDALATSEATAKSATHPRSTTDAPTTADAVTRSIVVGGVAVSRTATDALTVAMVADRIGSFHSTATDAPTTAEVLIGTKFALVVRTASESLNAASEGYGNFPVTGLVNYWKLDETSGTRLDSKGSISLTEENGPIVSATGRVGNAASLVAVGFQSLTNTGAITYPGVFTISLWFKEASFPAGNYVSIWSARNIGGNPCIELYVNPNQKVAVYVADNVLNRTVDGTGATTFTTGQWYHYAVTYDAVNGLNIYINGVLEANLATVGAFSFPTMQLGLGREMYGGPPRYHDGLIDEVGLWQQGLTATEIANLYNSGAGLPYVLVGAIAVVRPALVRTATDALTISEAASKAKVTSRAAADAPTTADVATGAKVSTLTRSATEALSTAESITKSATHPRTTTDALVTADVASKTAAHPRTTTDNPTTAEVASRTTVQSRTTTDALVIAETVTAIRTGAGVFARSTTETLTVAMVAAWKLTALRAAADALATAEVVSRGVPRVRTTTDTLTTAMVATAVRGTVSITRTATEILSTTELVVASKFGVVTRTATESLTANLVSSRVLAAGRIASDTLTAAEAANRRWVGARVATDMLTMVETAEAGGTAFLFIAGQVTGSTPYVTSAGSSIRISSTNSDLDVTVAGSNVKASSTGSQLRVEKTR